MYFELFFECFFGCEGVDMNVGLELIEGGG